MHVKYSLDEDSVSFILQNKCCVIECESNTIKYYHITVNVVDNNNIIDFN